jgi:hypothetical protein
MKIAGSGSTSQRHGSADPDPQQNVMDPQHCFYFFSSFYFNLKLTKDICFNTR